MEKQPAGRTAGSLFSGIFMLLITCEWGKIWARVICHSAYADFQVTSLRVEVSIVLFCFCLALQLAEDL
jgi:hypothetical protein